MRVKQKNGKFASKKSALYRFVNRTGKSVEEYYEWAKECGKRASFAYKDRLVCECMSVDSLSNIAPLEIGEGQQIMSVDELSDYILNHSENPADIAASWLEITDQEDTSIDGFLDQNLRPTMRESFERWGDKNNLIAVSPSWFSRVGVALDVQAMQLSDEYGKDITEADIVSYLVTYRKNQYKSTWTQLAEKYEQRFESLFGFRIDQDYAKHLKEAIYAADYVLDPATETASF